MASPHNILADDCSWLHWDNHPPGNIGRVPPRRFSGVFIFPYDIISFLDDACVINRASHGGALVVFVFGRMSLDPGRRELRSGSTVVPIEPKVFDLLQFLICNRDRVVSRDDLVAAVWGGRSVSDSAIAVRINAARRAIGDDGEHQRLIRTVARKGFRFVGDLREEPGLAAWDPSDAAAGQRTASHGPRDQKIAFCKTRDGINLAVASVGDGMPLVSTPTWATHLEYDWQSPARARLWRRLADRFRLIRYDARGFGLSDRDVPEISFATFGRDLEAVIASLDVRRYALLAISQGVATAVAHAVRNPDRVSKMVLHGGFARGRNKRNSAKDAEMAKAWIAVMRQGWGDDDSALLRIFSSVWLPGASAEQISWYANTLRKSTSVDTAIRSRSVADEIDIDELLPKVSVPTLVLHCRHDNSVPFDEGRRMAALIPNASFVSLDSENHVPLPEEPAWQTFVGEIETFLGDG
jgi:DNA-binding winged helix-turn-helix (wHTH) protein/pimeloyl-ACP methyl ester carboxylesterase